MALVVLSLLVWFVGMMVACFYAHYHQTDFDPDGALALTVMLVVVFWPAVLLVDFILYGTGAWAALKHQLLLC